MSQKNPRVGNGEYILMGRTISIPASVCAQIATCERPCGKIATIAVKPHEPIRFPKSDGLADVVGRLFTDYSTGEPTFTPDNGPSFGGGDFAGGGAGGDY